MYSMYDTASFIWMNLSSHLFRMVDNESMHTRWCLYKSKTVTSTDAAGIIRASGVGRPGLDGIITVQEGLTVTFSLDCTISVFV